MHSRFPLWARMPLAVLMVAGCAAVVLRADERLTSVYTAVLRGDYEGGWAELNRLRSEAAATPEVQRAGEWLDGFRQSLAARKEMKAQTLAWNVENARKALADGEVYLALGFAQQAAAYAADASAFAAEPWVMELTNKARAEAQRLAEEQSWSKALRYYALLGRIHAQDKHLEELREDAARHARLVILYKNQEALQKRITPDIDKNVFRTVMRLIQKNYYEEPDFKRMAVGALDNLIALAETRKLHEFLHGLGNPETRAYFVEALKKLRQAAEGEERFSLQDVLQMFNRVEHVNASSVELPLGLLVVEFLEGAVQQLDQFTSLIWPSDAADFDKAMLGNFQGVGIQLMLDERTNRLKVVTPLEDSPALEAGVQPDDLIIEVDGVSTKGWSTDDAVSKISGPAGTQVELTMFRPRTGQRLTFPLTRRKIVLRTVRGVERKAEDQQSWNYMLDRQAGIAYLRLSGFHPDTEKELLQALRAAQEQGMRGLILDVRHNPGGLLETAVEVVSAFLHSGEVVSTGGRDEPPARLRVSGEDVIAPEIPLVVLVNEGSASASEILAGALKEHRRAIVLGERTFGKGSVQKVLGIGKDNRVRLKLTTALYYLPSGRSPHKEPDSQTWGVDPNWEVKLTPKELRQVFKRETEVAIIHNEAKTETEPDSRERDKQLDELKDDKGEDDGDPPLLSDEQIKALEADPVPAPDADPQVVTALLLLRVKLAGDLPWPRDLVATVKTDKP